MTGKGICIHSKACHHTAPIRDPGSAAGNAASSRSFPLLKRKDKPRCWILRPVLRLLTSDSGGGYEVCLDKTLLLVRQEEGRDDDIEGE